MFCHFIDLSNLNLETRLRYLRFSLHRGFGFGHSVRVCSLLDSSAHAKSKQKIAGITPTTYSNARESRNHLLCISYLYCSSVL